MRNVEVMMSFLFCGRSLDSLLKKSLRLLWEVLFRYISILISKRAMIGEELSWQDPGS